MKRKSFGVAGLLLAVAFSLGMSTSGFGHDHELCSGFVPENSMKIPVGADIDWPWMQEAPKQGLTEEEFNAILDKAERLYTDVVAKAGGRLKVNRRWTDATVNASAQQVNGDWIINMYGGLARHPAIGYEGFALVVCHELGHHLGGYPKYKSWWGTQWATNEGGSDYYANAKCLRTFFEDEDNATITKDAPMDEHGAKVCREQFPDEADYLICLRNLMAAEDVAYLFMDLRKEKTKPQFNTPDPKVVTKMYDQHPATQCRMDTYFAGSVCDVRHDVPNSDTDENAGACVTPTHKVGTRPLCWFKPTVAAPEPAPVPPPAPETPENPAIFY